MISTNSDGHISLARTVVSGNPVVSGKAFHFTKGSGAANPAPHQAVANSSLFNCYRFTFQVALTEMNIFLDMRPSKGYNFCLRYLS
jgi:hypothetical protein